MRTIGTGLAASCWFVVATAAGARGQTPPPAPEQRFDELMAEQDAGSNPGVLTPAEREQFVGRVYRKHYEVALRFVELAEQHPRDPIAVRALIQAAWQVNGTPWPVELVGDDPASPRALALLQRDHVTSAELGPLCRRISYGHRAEYETFLRALLAGSPHPEVQGVACLSLAHFLNQRLQRLDLLELQPESRAEFAALFGAEYVEKLRKIDRAAATREVEGLLEQASRDYGTVQLPEGGTVGERAAAELFEVRHLCVGATAPEIEGVDQHGVRFELGDYRGKVVLLDFWSLV
jgi:hypothetical protein